MNTISCIPFDLDTIMSRQIIRPTTRKQVVDVKPLFKDVLKVKTETGQTYDDYV